jgi:hypothetical protein
LKNNIFLILLLFYGIGIAQTEFPFYEQIAFDFYQSKLIDSFPTKKKMKVYPYVVNFHPSGNAFSYPNCLGITWKSGEQFERIETYEKSQYNIESERFELDFTKLNKKKFKIKKRGKGNYPRLHITAPHKEKNGTERIFVNIHETHKYIYITYHFEFNQEGKIINWCKEMNEIIRTY